jgi:hypothetical protein
VATIVGRLDVRDLPADAAFVYGDRNSFRAHLATTAIKDISTEGIVPINPGKAISVCDALHERSKYADQLIVDGITGQLCHLTQPVWAISLIAV